MEKILRYEGKKGYRGKRGFVGAIQQRQQEKWFLRALINSNDIDLYLEIGTLWGGTAIIAALAGAKRVITIDSMDGLRWGEPDPWYPDEMVSKDRIVGNIYAFGVENIVELVQARSYPFPLKDIYPDITLIDGDHETETVKDWESVKDITKKVILIHDYNSNHLPLVRYLVDEVVKEDPDWNLVATVNCTAIIERIGEFNKTIATTLESRDGK